MNQELLRYTGEDLADPVNAVLLQEITDFIVANFKGIEHLTG